MWAFAFALPTALASIAAAAERTTPSMFDPVSTPAFAIRELSYLVFGITGLIFVVVAGLAVYTLIRFRSRAGDERGEPPQIYGSTQIEIAWTVVPAPDRRRALPGHRPLHLRHRATRDAGRSARGHRRRASVVVGDPLPGARDRDRQRDPRPGERSSRRRRRPSSRSSPSTSSTASGCPSWRGRWTSSRTRRTACGSIRGRPAPTSASAPSTAAPSTRGCCSWSSFIRATSSSAGWRPSVPRPATRSPPGPGQLFHSLACINCHTVRGTPANGVFGPDLTHLMSRRTIGAGAASNTPENAPRVGGRPGRDQARGPDARHEAVERRAEPVDRLPPHTAVMA